MKCKIPHITKHLKEAEINLPYTKAEKMLWQEHKTGRQVKASNIRTITKNTKFTQDSIIRATFLRHVIDQQDCKRIDICRACIYGELDLTYTNLETHISICHSYFEETPQFKYSKNRGITLDHSVIPGLDAEGIQCEGSIHIKEVKSSGHVNFSSAIIEGNLRCTGALFAPIVPAKRPDDYQQRAFTANGLRCRGIVKLYKITALGAVSFLGARIRGDLNFEGATLNYKCEKSYMREAALSMNQATIEGRLHFNKMECRPIGHMGFRGCSVGELRMDKNSWPANSDNGVVDLHGFTYQRIGSPTDFKFLKSWLDLMPKYWEFSEPQDKGDVQDTDKDAPPLSSHHSRKPAILSSTL